jgi:hypothetical protein
MPDVIEFYNFSDPSNRTMALRSTQPVTEVITTNLPGNTGQLALETAKLISNCESIMYKICILNILQPYGL